MELEGNDDEVIKNEGIRMMEMIWDNGDGDDDVMMWAFIDI